MEGEPRQPFLPDDERTLGFEAEDIQLPEPELHNRINDDGNMEVDPKLRQAIDELADQTNGRFHVQQLTTQIFGRSKVARPHFDPLMDGIRELVTRGDLIRLGEGNYQVTKRVE